MQKIIIASSMSVYGEGDRSFRAEDADTIIGTRTVKTMIIQLRIEIPIKYRKRLEASKITSTKWKSFKLGLQMIKTALIR